MPYGYPWWQLSPPAGPSPFMPGGGTFPPPPDPNSPFATVANRPWSDPNAGQWDFWPSTPQIALPDPNDPMNRGGVQSAIPQGDFYPPAFNPVTGLEPTQIGFQDTGISVEPPPLPSPSETPAPPGQGLNFPDPASTPVPQPPYQYNIPSNPWAAPAPVDPAAVFSTLSNTPSDPYNTTYPYGPVVPYDDPGPGAQVQVITGNTPLDPTQTPYPYDPGNAPSTTADVSFPVAQGQVPGASGVDLSFGTPGTGVPGTALSPADVANMTNFGPNDPFASLSPAQQAAFNNLPGGVYPSGFHPGQMMVDAAGNLVNAAGNIIKAAGTFTRDAAGNILDATGNIINNVINNIANSPGYSSPAYLQSIGYTPGQGTGSLLPPEGFAGARGGPLPGSFGYYGLGGGGPTDISSFGGDIFARHYLRQLMEGNYTSPSDVSQMAVQAPAVPFAWPASQPVTNLTYQQYRQGQVDLGNFLRANPNWISQHFGGGGGGTPAQTQRTARGTPPPSPQ